MKLLLLAIMFVVFGFELAESSDFLSKLRLAESSEAVCLSSCANQSESCKRACPATFNTPCLSSCDSQYQTCLRSCKRN